MHSNKGEKSLTTVKQKPTQSLCDLEDGNIFKSIDDDIVKARSFGSILKNIRNELKRKQASEVDDPTIKREQTEKHEQYTIIFASAPTNRRKRSQPVKRTLQPKSSLFFIPNGPKPHQRPKSITRIRDIPGFFKHVKSQHERLASIEANTRIKLRAIKQQIAQSRVKILDLYEKANSRIGVLRKHQRTLSSFAEDLSRLGQLKARRADKLLKSLTLFDNQRKQLMNDMIDPQWARPHCFYMFAIEHFRGNQQPHLLELAEAMPGNLAIAAVANQAVQQHKETLQKYDELKTTRSLLQEKLAVVTKRREICRAHLKDYKKMLIVMKNKMSSDERDKIRQAEKKMSVGQPLIVHPQRRSGLPGFWPKMMKIRRKPDDFRRGFLRATGVVEQPIRDVKTTWQKTNTKDFLAQVERFLKETPSNDIVRSTSLRKLELSASTRRLFAMTMPSANLLSASPCNSSMVSMGSLSPISNLDENCHNLETSNLLPSPITMQSTYSEHYCPPVLNLSPTRGSDVDYNLTVNIQEVTKEQGNKSTNGNTPLYNRDWSVLADILKNISNAYNEKGVCVAKLNNIVEKRDAFKMEVAKLESDWMSTTGKIIPRLFHSLSSVPSEKKMSEQKEATPEIIEQIIDEDAVAQPEEEPIIV